MTEEVVKPISNEDATLDAMNAAAGAYALFAQKHGWSIGFLLLLHSAHGLAYNLKDKPALRLIRSAIAAARSEYDKEKKQNSKKGSMK